VYSVKKFPNDERDDWIAENKNLVEEQVEKFAGLFDDTLKDAFEQTMAEYLFLSNAMEAVAEWKQNFARFLSYSIDAAETQIQQDKRKEAFLRGRLSMIKEVLDWF
jgi:DNA repair exonuclease SbcCD ATPase subunit